MNDLDTWDQLLRLHVDQAGRVDYAGWLSHHPHTLSHWLAAQTAETDGRQEHLAHWINLYNAFTIQAVLKAYPIASIRPTLLSLPNWIGFLAFFQRKRHRLAKQWISLAWIENRMLRQQGDPRIHFAIVCASLGCPLLRNEAYRPELVEQQLDDDLKRFVNNPSKVRYDPEQNILFCSKIFQWYKADFLDEHTSLSHYILPHLTTSSKPINKQNAELNSQPSTETKTEPSIETTNKPRSHQNNEPHLSFLPYDWSLNQRMSS